MQSLSITDERIISFFETHGLDPISFIHNMMDIYAYIQKTITSSNSDQVLRYIIENSSQLSRIETNQKMHQESLSEIKHRLHNITSEINATIISRLLDMKNMYIEDLKNMLQQQDQNAHEKLMIHMNRIGEIVNDSITRLNEAERRPIEQALTNLQVQMSQETSRVMMAIDKRDAMLTLIDVFNNKWNDLANSLQTHMHNQLTSSEARVTSILNELKETAIESSSLTGQVNSLLDKFNNSTRKGKLSENVLTNVLTKLYPSGEIKETRSEAHSCDIRLHRLGKSDILFENKSYTRNVNKDEVQKFQEDLATHECNGIMLSQDSGITHKPDFHIEISPKTNKIAIYLHNVNYNSEKIELAVDIMDNMQECLERTSGECSSSFSISEETMRIINHEYQMFVKNRENLIGFLRESNNEAILKVKNMELPQIMHVLGLRNAKESMPKETKKIANYQCKNCNSFVAENRKVLAEHKKTCSENLAPEEGACLA